MNDRYARLLQLVLAGRPEALTAAFLGTLPEEEARAYLEVEQTLASFAQTAAPVAPSAPLRERVLSSFRARLARPPKSAFLVLDMIVDHLAEGSVLEVPRAREIVPALAQKLAECRKQGVPVVYIVDEHDPDDPDLALWGVHAIAGTGGNDIWPEVAPEPGDRIVKKHTYSAFTGSTLQSVLDELRCDTLILGGCLTEVGIKATATEALQRGYAVDVPRATQAGISAPTEHLTLGLLQVMPPYGAARKELLARLTAPASTA
ncbi:isochorismatase family protein [Pendulispora albinea]|uniref:Cysteine hydrolase n=1 Tax=Pendulispora albinea TaxID=2741071 RepID=A0ABZ2LPD9_9BACT